MYLGLTKIPPVSDSTRNNKSPKGDWTFLCWFILLLIDFWFKIKPYATQMQFLCGCCDTRGCKSLKIQFIYFHWLHYKFFAQWSDHHWSLSSVVASHLFQVWLMFFYFFFFWRTPSFMLPQRMSLVHLLPTVCLSYVHFSLRTAFGSIGLKQEKQRRGSKSVLDVWRVVTVPWTGFLANQSLNCSETNCDSSDHELLDCAPVKFGAFFNWRFNCTCIHLNFIKFLGPTHTNTTVFPL